jgi:hypothetical protein
MYVHDVEECIGENANGDGNRSSEPVSITEYDAEPESIADSDSRTKSRTESEPERQPKAGAES